METNIIIPETIYEILYSTLRLESQVGTVKVRASKFDIDCSFGVILDSLTFMIAENIINQVREKVKIDLQTNDK